MISVINVRKFYDMKLINYLTNANKKPIFKIGKGGKSQLSCIYRCFDSNNIPLDYKVYYHFIDNCYHTLKEKNLKYGKHRA
jgi:hypothetical protein